MNMKFSFLNFFTLKLALVILIIPTLSMAMTCRSNFSDRHSLNAALRAELLRPEFLQNLDGIRLRTEDNPYSYRAQMEIQLEVSKALGRISKLAELNKNEERSLNYILDRMIEDLSTFNINDLPSSRIIDEFLTVYIAELSAEVRRSVNVTSEGNVIYLGRKFNTNNDYVEFRRQATALIDHYKSRHDVSDLVKLERFRTILMADAKFKALKENSQEIVVRLLLTEQRDNPQTRAEDVLARIYRILGASK